MNDNQITKKQHFLPQVYLRGFSVDHKAICAFRLDNNSISKSVPIKSVCSENYLYEVVNQDGKFLAPNHIEKFLGKIESMFGTFRKQLMGKARNPENFKTCCFLTTQEKAFWIAYTAIQILRMPKIIHEAEDFSRDYLKDYIEPYKAEIVAHTQCLPFFGEINPEDKNLFNYIVKMLCDMYINIFFDPADSIFTSDNPIYCCAPDFSNGECEQIIFPIASNIVLMFYGSKLKKKIGRKGRNRLIPLTKEEIDSIKMDIAYTAEQWIYSKNNLPYEDIQLIHKARHDRK